jgi:hypothetical protein
LLLHRRPWNDRTATQAFDTVERTVQLGKPPAAGALMQAIDVLGYGVYQPSLMLESGSRYSIGLLCFQAPFSSR